MGSRPFDVVGPARPVVYPWSRRVAGGRLGVGSSLALRVAAWATLAPLLLLATVALLTLAGRDEVSPGVRVAGVAVGGLGEDAARARVRDRAAALARQPVALTLGDRTWTPLPADLGIAYDADASVDRAMAVGREHRLRDGLLGATRLARGSVTVPLAITLDRSAFDAYLDGLEAESGGAPVDAAVAIEGTRVVVTPARDGRAVDRAAARAALVARIARLEPVSLALREQVSAAVVGTDQATAAKAVLDRALAEPMVLTLGGEEWRLAPTDLAPLARVTATERDGARTLIVGLDKAALHSLVADIAAEVDAVAADAWAEDFGTHRRLVPASSGREVRRDDLERALQEAFAAGEHTVTVPVVEGAAPEVTTEALLADLGVTDLLATGDSDFAGSDPARDANVRLAADLVDGTLVPPGGVFSYNAALGSIFAAGFVEADSTIDGIPGTSLGGGVCQVSTTVFRAALRAGLPIAEWWPHAFRSPFYEQGGWSPGFDASIVQDAADPAAGSDFRFTNPTDAWLLVRAAVVDGTVLRVELRGAPTGYAVRVEDPVQEATGAGGGRVTVVRRVADAAGNEVAADTFVSVYRPQDD